MKAKIFITALLACIINVVALASDPGPMTKDIENTYWTAVKYFQEEDYNKALLNFQHVLDTNPENVELNYYVGMCYYYLNKPKLAKWHFSIAADDNNCRLKIMLLARDNDIENIPLSYNQ